MIPILPLRLRFEAGSALSLPAYTGSLWRSALGARLRADACITGANDCDGCPVKRRCAYGRLFEPMPAHNATGVARNFRDPPRRYVISPRHGGGRYQAGACLAVDVLLAGESAHDFAAIRRTATRLRLHDTDMALRQIHLVPPDGSEPRDLMAAPAAETLEAPPPPVPTRARIVLEHPLRLRQQGRNVDAGSFSLAAFATALFRRISALGEVATGHKVNADFAGLKRHVADNIHSEALDLEWFDCSRRSVRQDQRVPMGGLIGSFTIAGQLAPLWPWLWLGQWVHVGKGAVMGLGRYRIQVLT